MRGRPAGCVLAAVILAAAFGGCGGRLGNEGTAESADSTAARDVPAAVAIPKVTAASPEPLAPWQVLVAVAKPEITLLETFDAPGGLPVRFEVPLANPWYFGGELALLVEEGREHDDWLRVGVPTRPNGTTAWIRRGDVDIRTHRIHAEVAVEERRLRVWDGDLLLLDAPATIGKASTPTPLGRFFVNARIVHNNPAGAYGPWILSLSGFSEVLDTFDGGLPELAIHGTNRPEHIGQPRSNGCIRVPNGVIEELSQVVPLGTPVVIVA